MSSNAASGSPEPGGSTALADPIAEGRRLVTQAGESGLTVRLLGGVAVCLQAPGGRPLLSREVHDIDLVAPRDAKRAVETFFSGIGYLSDEAFNAFHGHHRQLYVDLANERKVDVFVGSFSMCHAVPIADRLTHHPLTLPLPELLLTKLQIVQLNERDERDIYNLCFHHPMTLNESDADGIDAGFVARLCAGDWGLWRTATGTIERCRADLPECAGLDAAARELIVTRLDELAATIESTPKTGKWKRRSRLGERVRWYQEPEEE